MAEYTAYANYAIYFRDETEYNDAIALAGGFYFQHSPQFAAATFGLTYPQPGGPLGDRGMYTYFYSMATPGSDIFHPGPTGLTMDDNVDSVLVPGQAGVPASIWPAGPDCRLTWCGTIIRVGGGSGSSPAPTASIPQRRWIEGFEAPNLVGGGSGISDIFSRDASRTCEGLGMALRDDVSRVKTNTTTQFGAATNGNRSWERFYIRIRTANPTARVLLWTARGNPTPSNGATLWLNTSGQLEFFHRIAGVDTLVGTSGVLALETKYKVDVALSYSTMVDLAATPGGQLWAFLNGVNFAFAAPLPAVHGIADPGQTHADSSLGNNDGSANTYELDVDSWINADIPIDANSAASFTSVDFLAGSHVSKQWNDSVQAAVGWSEPVLETTNQLANPTQVSTGARTRSTTADDRLRVRTNYTDEQDSIGAKIGAVAVVVGLWSENAAGSNGELGYAILGGSPTMTSINQINTPNQDAVAYLPAPMSVPAAIEPLDVVHDKSNDTDQDTTYGMQAFVENIGTYGQEDDADSDIPDTVITHNAYYPNTQFSFVGPLPDAPVFAVGGTYVGNDTSQHIDLPHLCHFLWIRPLTSGAGGVKWFGAGLGGHLGDTNRVVPDYVTRIWVDSTGQPKFTVTGPNSQVNANGVTYQYIAFCDPGMRYNICGAFRHAASLASATNPLLDDAFTPEAAWAQIDTIAASGAAGNMLYKGPGSAGNTGRNMSGTNVANFGTFPIGDFISRADLHGTQAQTNYSVWRSDDGTGVMCQILTYTGNGVSPRTITLTPTSGRFPLLAVVVAHGSTSAIMRDPSDAGTASTQVKDGNPIAANGIRGASNPDEIIVGSDLNANGTVYDVFVICGDTAGWNNGEFYPPSIGSPGSLWPVPNDDPADISVVGEGGIEFGGAASLLLVENLSGIYELVPGKRNDTILTQAGTNDNEEDVAIPRPYGKTGYIGG